MARTISVDRLTAEERIELMGEFWDVRIPHWPDAADDAAKPAFERVYGRLWTDTPNVVVSTSLKEPGRKTRVVSSGV